jgi:uncharacterized Zn-finger protein
MLYGPPAVPTGHHSTLYEPNQSNVKSEIGGDLEYHTENKGEYKPFACHCGKTFKHSRNLITHRKTHSVSFQDQLTCQYCAKMFSRENNKIRHEKSIHEGVIYNCSLCGKSYSQKDKFVRHVKKFHPATNVKPIEQRKAYK